MYTYVILYTYLYVFFRVCIYIHSIMCIYIHRPYIQIYNTGFGRTNLEALRPWGIAMFPRHPASRHRADTPTRATSRGSTTPDTRKIMGYQRSVCMYVCMYVCIYIYMLKLTNVEKSPVGKRKSASSHQRCVDLTLPVFNNAAAAVSSALAEAEMCFSRLSCLLMTSS